MKSYTFSEARQHLASVLEQARRDAMVRIEWRDGQRIVLMPEVQQGSPLDVPGVTLCTPVTRDDIMEGIQEGR